MKQMKIFITGAAGFIGSNLSKFLLERGHIVTGIDNFSYGETRNIAPILNHPNYSFINGDICNPFIYNDVHAEVIVHLASQKIPRYNNAFRTLIENETMLKNIVKKALQDNSRILFASTSDVYGKNPIVPFSEESDLLLGPTTVKRWAYALSKIYGEHYLIACGEEYGLKYTINRFFGSYGPNQNLTWWGGPQSLFIEKALKKEPIDIHGDGTQTRTFTFIEDTIAGITKCIESEDANKEIVNIASNPEEEVTILDLAKLIWKIVNPEDREPMINFVPYATFGKYEDVARRVPNIDKLINKFNYKPEFSLERGLVETIKWQSELTQNNK
jgi:UDP-glucose 4-epimerase